MALPKNHNQLKKREEALMELNFYNVKFDYEYTNRFRELLKDGDETSIKISESITGKHEFTAFNSDDASRKTNEFLSGLVGKDILQKYDIKSVESVDFVEKVKSKGLGEYLNLK